MEEEKLVITFGGSKQTVIAERAMKEAGFDTRSIPCPRWLSLNCGIVLLIKRSDKDRVVRELSDRGIEFEGIHPLRPPQS